ncbi:SulP family inorganic anion transporter [Pseudonocardia sp. KRD291]|uniref:SulP family inorganic anion transporter n=1 Tax=Pseudonocardia sp. KRD291 TaxID=2792007 RepID=UPI001C4A2F40|nr:SulP family inorganic anion transporter [Pseudonocardia sp. KRD291]MBW0106151.1 bifunctional SulP family inorganic anion transporter/carbonic anhydrase [Pseudonocardia sp. KRD291]
MQPSRKTITGTSTRTYQDEHSPTESGQGEHSPPPAGLRSCFPHARADLSASLVVFLVAVPLSLGIAVASGAPILAGLVAAVVGAIVAGLLGGSPMQVSGPAAGLTVVVAELIDRFGWQVTCLITAGAGVIQIVFGMSRLARFAQAIPPSVVHGMLAGIGVTIALAQLNVVFGGESQTAALESLAALPGSIIGASWPTLLVGALAIAVMLAWPKLPARARVVPGALVAVVLATVVALAFPEVTRVQLGGSLLDAIALPVLPEGNWAGVIGGMLTIALIASVESLLSAVAVERMKPGTRTDADRELLGQGAANTVSGLVGGLPITGVIVRSSANVRAGAQTRASAVLHGVWIAVFAILLVGIVEMIPMAGLAGLLVVVGLQLVKPADIRTARTHGELAIYLVTVLGVLLLNLLEGVAIGLALAGVMLLVRAVRSRPQLDGADGANADGPMVLRVEGSLSFLAVPALSRRLGEIPAGRDVRIDLVTDYLDHAAYDHLQAWTERHRSTGARVEVVEPTRLERTTTNSLDGTPRFASWSHWQATGAEGRTAESPMLAGLAAYHERTADDIRPTMSELAAGQSPPAMMVTCADSRVMPHMITHSGPGDVFTVQNVGNLAGGQGTMAAVEYATGVLGVPLIAVCGHSGCGAMNGLSQGAAGQDAERSAGGTSIGPELGTWLLDARPVLRAWEQGHPVGVAAAADGFAPVDQLAMVNVAMQLEMLRARDTGAELMGLFYDIATARVLVLDGRTQHFVPPRVEGATPDEAASLDRIAAGHGHGTAGGAGREHVAPTVR